MGRRRRRRSRGGRRRSSINWIYSLITEYSKYVTKPNIFELSSYPGRNHRRHSQSSLWEPAAFVINSQSEGAKRTHIHTPENQLAEARSLERPGAGCGQPRQPAIITYSNEVRGGQMDVACDHNEVAPGTDVAGIERSFRVVLN